MFATIESLFARLSILARCIRVQQVTSKSLGLAIQLDQLNPETDEPSAPAMLLFAAALPPEQTALLVERAAARLMDAEQPAIADMSADTLAAFDFATDQFCMAVARMLKDGKQTRLYTLPETV